MRAIKFFLYFLFTLTGTAQASNITFLTHFIRPFTYQENGEFKGFAVELVKEMMKITQYPRHFQMYPFKRALAVVQNNPDYALFIVAKRPDRENTLKWVGPLISNGVYFYKKKTASIKIHNLDDARNARLIGVGRGNSDHKYLHSLGFNNLHPTNNQMQSVQMLITDRVTLIPIGEMVMPEMAKHANIDPMLIERTEVKLYETELYLVFSKNIADDRIEQWQQALDQLKMSGKYQEIFNKYIH